MMVELIVTDGFGRMMFKAQVQDYLCVAMGDHMVPMIDQDDNYLGRSIDWETFKQYMDRAY